MVLRGAFVPEVMGWVLQCALVVWAFPQVVLGLPSLEVAVLALLQAVQVLLAAQLELALVPSLGYYPNH